MLTFLFSHLFYQVRHNPTSWLPPSTQNSSDSLCTDSSALSPQDSSKQCNNATLPQDISHLWHRPNVIDYEQPDEFGSTRISSSRMFSTNDAKVIVVPVCEAEKFKSTGCVIAAVEATFAFGGHHRWQTASGDQQSSVSLVLVLITAVISAFHPPTNRPIFGNALLIVFRRSDQRPNR